LLEIRLLNDVPAEMESEKEIWEQEHLKIEQSGDATECGEADKLHLPKEGSISPPCCAEDLRPEEET
jgi:hypothetical protein